MILTGGGSAGRHALEGAPLAPGTQRTLEQLRDLVRRPTVSYVPLPQALLHHQAERPFSLGKTLLLKNLKRARRGAAAGPSEVTTEHLKSVLGDTRDAERLFPVALLVAQANIPQEILTLLRMGRVGASAASWQAMCSGDLSRELWPSSLVQRLSVPRARMVECMAHAIRCQSMASYRLTLCLARQCWKVSRLWRGRFSDAFSCSNSTGPYPHTPGKTKKVSYTSSCERRGKSDPLRPALFSLGQHPALQAVQAPSRWCAFSLSWMMSMSCAHRRGSTRYVGFCSMHSSLIFGFTTGGLKFGIVAVWPHWALRCFFFSGEMVEGHCRTSKPQLGGTWQPTQATSRPAKRPQDLVDTGRVAVSTSRDPLLQQRASESTSCCTCQQRPPFEVSTPAPPSSAA